MTTNKKPSCGMYTRPSEIDIRINNNTDCVECGRGQFEHSDGYAIDTITIGDVTLNAGDVIRLSGMEKSAFHDAVILGFCAQGWAKISRPYVYASLTGTLCAGPLLGCETFTVSIKSILEHDTRIDKGRITR